VKIAPRNTGDFVHDQNKAFQFSGILLHGSDEEITSLCAHTIVETIISGNKDTPFETTTLNQSVILKDQSILYDSLREFSFWEPRKIVLIMNVTDSITKTVDIATLDLPPGNAILIMTSGALGARSRIRLLFEERSNLASVSCYDNAALQPDIKEYLHKVGITNISNDAIDLLDKIRHNQNLGIFENECYKLLLYKQFDDSPITTADIKQCYFGICNINVYELIDLVVTGKIKYIPEAIRKCDIHSEYNIITNVLLKRLHILLEICIEHEEKTSLSISGSLRSRIKSYRMQKTMVEQSNMWDTDRLRQAISMVADTEESMRSGRVKAPLLYFCLIERTLVKVASVACHKRKLR